MIFAHSIISGYVSLQGSATMHLPMLFAMLVFVDIPNEENSEVFPDGVKTWYYFAAAMHLICSVLHL